jgi:hypothetical protein
MVTNGRAHDIMTLLITKTHQSVPAAQVSSAGYLFRGTNTQKYAVKVRATRFRGASSAQTSTR